MLPFDQFMARALHDPVNGYYARRVSAIGRKGDFTTAPTLSDLPARAIARWAARAFRECGTCNLIEIGPGQGILAADVLKLLPWHLRLRVRLHLVETSAPLRELQQQLLGRRANWHSSPAAALALCDGKAVIYHNELVDAFPVRRFQKTDLGWQEIAIQFDPIQEILLPPGALPDSSSFQHPHPIGQQIEVHESYQQWIDQWVPHWKSGRMLTIDYGSTAEEIYHRRPRGTIRAYLFHQRLEGLEIYQNPGRQDLTADINFTDLIGWSKDWTSQGNLRNLREFLTGSGTSPETSIDKQLLDAAAAFQVLDQRRNG